MNIETNKHDRQLFDDAATRGQKDTEMRRLAEDAARLIAPLWPLKNFVAVNPMLGFTERRFEQAATDLAKTRGANLLMSREYYAAKFARAEFTETHIQTALEAHDLSDAMSVEDIKKAMREPAPIVGRTISNVAELATADMPKDWSSFVTDQISFWAAGYFDEGQANWINPFRKLPAFAAWRQQTSLDRTPELLGLTGFRALVAGMPSDEVEALHHAVDLLGIPTALRADYFHSLLASVSGWAGHIRFRGWTNELRGDAPSNVIHLLAIRAVYDAILLECLPSSDLKSKWAAALQVKSNDNADAVDRIALVLQTAVERAHQNRLTAEMAAAAEKVAPSQDQSRADVQAVFCIDVRSERFRRALEHANPRAATYGFAGFFGFPAEVARLGEMSGGAQCPVLLAPGFLVRETAAGDDDALALQQKKLKADLRKSWKRFKYAAVSSFAFVEAWGVGFLGAILQDTFGRPQREATPLDELSIEHDHHGHRIAGLDADTRIALARGALAGMSLDHPFARIVLLAGHGSTTTNNPYASGLDCGACGGHSGEANARIAVKVLNDPAVRVALAREDINIPDDTVFVAALHDTTTDDVTCFDEADIPSSHAADLANLKRDLIDAGRAVRRERADSLGVMVGPLTDEDVVAKSKDWSEVRPEWGLAGCAAFIAAPRARTTDVDLDGRAFLHSYYWRADKDFSVLELIMTAPLVVASWINLQYYGSTVDNAAFGSGDKTLHNVVSGLGVLEGNGGDLRVGLPLQSVHDGEKPVHEPLRLCAMIEAPIEAINDVLEKHPHVRALFDNQWLRLIAIEDEGRAFKAYAGDLSWADEPVQGLAKTSVAA